MGPLVLASVALILTASPEQEHRHPDHPQWTAGVRGAVMLARQAESPEDGESGKDTLMGGNFFIEHVLIPAHLELEMSATFVESINRPMEVLGVDLHLIVPFTDTKIQPYVGFGPALVHEFSDDGLTLVGLGSAIGTYMWFSEHFGLDIEVDYNFFPAAGRVHELNFAAGPIAHF